MKPLALKWRTCLLVTMVLVVAAAVVCGVAYHEMAEALYSSIDSTLKAMSEGIVAALDDPQGPADAEAEIRDITGHVSLGHGGRYRVWAEGAAKDLYASSGRTQAGHAWMWKLDGVVPPGVGQTTYFYQQGLDGKEYRAAWTRRSNDGKAVNVLVGFSTSHIRHEMQEFLRVLLIVATCVILGAVCMGVSVVLWSLRPIDKTARRLGEITHRDLGQAALEDIDAPAELVPFVDAVRKMLARLDAAMKRQAQFTGDASHELRTPLASAKSTLQATRSRPRSAEQYERALDETLGDLDRMERLIRQLLALARMDDLSAAPQREPVRLDALLADLAAAANAAGAGEGGQERVACGLLPETTVAGDAEELAQLFRNLIDNALVHGPAGGKVTVSIAPGGEADASVTVTVHDEGGQIPPESLGRLFDRFYRVDSSRSSATGGTGLGLAIAKEIVDRHDGHIEIASDPQAGTTVTVALPAAGMNCGL